VGREGGREHWQVNSLKKGEKRPTKVMEKVNVPTRKRHCMITAMGKERQPNLFVDPITTVAKGGDSTTTPRRSTGGEERAGLKMVQNDSDGQKGLI